MRSCAAVVSFVLLLFCTAQGATIRVATHNILNFPESFGLERLDDLRTVVRYIGPDIYVVQEMQSQAGVDLLLDSVMRPLNSNFSSVLFNDGPDTDNALFYRNDKIDLVGVRYYATPTRDIAEYRLLISETGSELYIFSVHLKASEGASNELLRLQEATVLRDRLDLFPIGTDFLVVGDFNIYYSDEPAFGKLTDSLQNANGRSIDPISSLGYWHENTAFAACHTQSSRVDQLPDGGAGGGMDDRFDMILGSASMLDTAGLYLERDSYTAVGNDGAHFNLAVNDGFNTSVPDSVADALYAASDHLPVYVDLSDEPGVTADEPVVKVWPNPMQHSATVTLPWFDGFLRARVQMTNILGQRVYDDVISDPEGFVLDRGDLPVGVYFLHIVVETDYTEHLYQTRVAMVK